jgi:ABC-2 type transport system ATP-binding protein
MLGRLLGLSKADAAARGDELLAAFGIADARDRKVSTYSGGMRRRLDIAASLILRPRLLFLDEPTTGLDPRGRNEVWEAIRDLVRGGTTVLLTTQYLDEADQLADRISVIDRGRTIVTGTPSDLKNTVGADQIEVQAAPSTDLARVAAAFDDVATSPPEISQELMRVVAPVGDRVAALTTLAGRLHADGVVVEDISLRRPTLDDVFLQLTGHRAAEPDSTTADPRQEATT